MRAAISAIGLVGAMLLMEPILLHAAQGQAPATASGEKQLTSEEKMNSRYPQPVRAGFLIGLPVLDDNDSTIGYIEQVVRTPAGKIQLIVPYRPRFGWLRNGILDWGRRPVAVPIEVVAILARQVAALDMSREEFDASPPFSPSQAAAILADEMIKIAITRR